MGYYYLEELYGGPGNLTYVVTRLTDEYVYNFTSGIFENNPNPTFQIMTNPSYGVYEGVVADNIFQSGVKYSIDYVDTVRSKVVASTPIDNYTRIQYEGSGIVYIPSGIQYIPSGITYIPSGIEYVPSGITYIPSGIEYILVPSGSTVSRVVYVNTDGATTSSPNTSTILYNGIQSSVGGGVYPYGLS